MITTLLLPLSLAFIMFSMGLALTVEDFRRLLSHPLAMGFGLFSQIVMLPAIAFGLASLFALQPELAVGLIILAASPGGITSNLLTHIAGGDGALSVSLTAVTSLAGVITIPIMVNLGLSHYAGATETVQLPLATMITGIFFIATLPLLLGMALRRFRHGWAAWLEPRSRKLAVVLFLMIVAATFLGQWGSISDYFAAAGPAVVALNLATMGFALLGSSLLQLGQRQGIAIVLECGLQNAAMGIFIANTLLESGTMVIPSIIYALVMNISAAAVILANREPARRFLFSR